jgi:hypothetical protein
MGIESGKRRLLIAQFYSKKIRIVKWAPAFTPCGRRNAFMSDLAKREGTLACPRCKAPMKEIVRIAAIQSEPGLIAYECPSCGYVTSVLIRPLAGDAASRPRRL